MSVGSGIGASCGISGAESSYNTLTTPVKWWEFDSETLARSPKRADSNGLSGGTMLKRGSQRVTTSSDVQGDVVGNVFTKGMGHWLAQLMGSAATPVQQASTAAYLQTHTLGNDAGISRNIQIGKPTLDGTVRPHTYKGVKILGGKFECGLDELLHATFTVDAASVDDTTAITSPSYATSNAEFHFAQSEIKLGSYGSEAHVEGVRKVSISIVRKSKVDRFYVGNAGLKSEPIQNDFFEVTGTIDADYLDPTVFEQRVRDDTAVSLIWAFTGSTIASTYPYLFQIALPQIKWDPPGDANVSGPDVISGQYTFKAYYDDSHMPVLTYQSTDTTL